MQKDNSLTAIVVGFNHANCLGRCLSSLIGQRGFDRLEVIYLDNASEDDSVALASSFPDIRVIRNERNLGFARAVNQGLALARGYYVALVNPDTCLEPLALYELASVLRRRSEVALVGPMLFDESGVEQTSLAPYPTVWRLLRGHRRAATPSANGAARRVEEAWLLGALLVARTEQLRRLGGLEERFFVYGEDMDLCFRIQRRVGALWLEPSVRVLHRGNPHWTLDRFVRVYGAYMRFASLHAPTQRPLLGLVLSALWLLRGARAGQQAKTLARGLGRIWSMKPDWPTERQS